MDKKRSFNIWNSRLRNKKTKIFLKKGHTVTGLASTKKKSKELFEEINSESLYMLAIVI